jgi:hypothetical protein
MKRLLLLILAFALSGCEPENTAPYGRDQDGAPLTGPQVPGADGAY